ncbi:MAG: MlaD family protein [Muribaculaceae bacterium]|nr:MlaD family protein [Muribaculaceae bacterium]
MKNKISKEFIIGISVIVTILILIFGIDYLKGINLFTPANFYEVYYDNVSDLTVSSPVSVNGYKVGQVRDIEIDYNRPGKVKVTLALDKKLRLPQGTVAEMGQTLLSGAFINLKMGEGKEYLPVGSTVPSISDNDLMSAVQNELMPKINGILPKVDSLIHNLNQLAANPALSTSISRLDGITNDFSSVARSLNGTMGTLNGKLPLILNNVGKATVSLDTITGNLSELSAQLKTLPLQPTMENIEVITNNLSAFSAQLNDKNSSLGKLTSDPELYNRLNTVAADIDSLIVDIKKNPKRYISIKLL